MICHTCQHVMIQEYVNGEQSCETVWCQLVGTVVNGRLQKCSRFMEEYEEIENVTKHTEIIEAMDNGIKSLKNRDVITEEVVDSAINKQKKLDEKFDNFVKMPTQFDPVSESYPEKRMVGRPVGSKNRVK